MRRPSLELLLPRRLIDAGDSVMAIYDAGARGRRSGAEVAWRSIPLIFTMRGGKIIRIDHPSDLDEALKAVGPVGARLSSRLVTLRDTARAMSKQDSDVVRTNVQVVRGVYDGWIDGDVTRALEYLDPGIVWEAIPDAPDAGTYRGHAGVRRYMEDWLGDFDILGLDFEEIIDEGERLVITQCARATGKGSGAKTELHYAAAHRLEQGKIVEIREFRTKAEALEAAGFKE